MTLPQPVPVHTRYEDTHLMVDLDREAAYLDGAPLKLTYKSYALLAFLVRHPGELVSRETLLSVVWGYSPEIRTRTLDVHVRRLRKSLGTLGAIYIETIFGVGYRFQPYQEARLVAAAGRTAAAGAGTVWPWKVAGGAA